MIGCTEQPIQRPRDSAAQATHYSGKKKRHTLKTEYIVTAEGRIASVSLSHPASSYDLTIRSEGPALPRKPRGYADSAYQGYDKELSNLDIANKKPKDRDLTTEEKEYNCGLTVSGSRSSIETAGPHHPSVPLARC